MSAGASTALAVMVAVAFPALALEKRVLAAEAASNTGLSKPKAPRKGSDDGFFATTSSRGTWLVSFAEWRMTAGDGAAAGVMARMTSSGGAAWLTSSAETLCTVKTTSTRPELIL